MKIKKHTIFSVGMYAERVGKSSSYITRQLRKGAKLEGVLNAEKIGGTWFLEIDQKFIGS
jgi:hypothetical protein